ncbi:MAG TPA: tetratricopeptide repeat protein [Candidatus Obscuribacterales bacterium]
MFGFQDTNQSKSARRLAYAGALSLGLALVLWCPGVVAAPGGAEDDEVSMNAPQEETSAQERETSAQERETSASERETSARDGDAKSETAEADDEEKVSREKRFPEQELDRSVLEPSGKELYQPEKKKEIDFRDPHHHYTLAREALKKGDYKQALKEVNETLALNPNHWHATYVGCLALQMQGRIDEAIPRYRRLLRFRPDIVEAHTNLGVLLKKKGDLEGAEAEYRKAIELNFYHLDAHYNLANLLIDQDKLEPALNELKTCLKLDKTNAWVHNNLGVIYLRRGYYEEAEEEFLSALNLEPANKTFEKNLIAVRMHLKKKPVRA